VPVVPVEQVVVPSKEDPKKKVVSVEPVEQVVVPSKEDPKKKATKEKKRLKASKPKNLLSETTKKMKQK
jgi:hypothetical protein